MDNEPNERGKALCLVVMGVTGAGKSTLAAALGARLGIPYVDADSYHSPANVEKMKRGEPLTDEDRATWLAELRRVLEEAELGSGVVLACSALKDSYREVLGVPTPTRRLVFIRIDPEVARRRVARRVSHFMPMTLVESQFATLEPPSNATVVDATWPVHKAVLHVCDVLRGKDQP
jgi:gluconokinase